MPVLTKNGAQWYRPVQHHGTTKAGRGGGGGGAPQKNGIYKSGTCLESEYSGAEAGGLKSSRPGCINKLQASLNYRVKLHLK